MNSTTTVMTEETGVTEQNRAATQGRTKKERAMSVVKRYALFSAGVGIIPIPFFDQVAIGGLLAKMLYEITQVYNVKWSDHQIKMIVAAVLGGAHAEWIPSYLLHFANLNQSALFVGMTFARPLTAGGLAYAIGTLFVSHFESGAWLRHKEPKLFGDSQEVQMTG
jgi:uncharacterized protein (DUF697 family)